ncbi:MAG TPA: hypothetical protein VJ942_05145 [Roseovarius sp.]|nr:hypothetical protein [Roseovarius sp.]
MTRLQTVVELPEFQRRAKAIMSEQEREAAINFIAARVCGHSGFPFDLISDSNFQNGGLNERATICGVGRLVAAA